MTEKQMLNMRMKTTKAFIKYSEDTHIRIIIWENNTIYNIVECEKANLFLKNGQFRSFAQDLFVEAMQERCTGWQVEILNETSEIIQTLNIKN